MCLLVWFVTVPCVIPRPTSGVYCATRAVSVTAAPKASAAGTSCAGEGRRLSLNLDTKVALGPLPLAMLSLHGQPLRSLYATWTATVGSQSGLHHTVS